MHFLHFIANAIYHVLGVNGSGPYYGFWSGFGSDIGEVTVVGGAYMIYKHHNCAQKGCWRIGKIVTKAGHLCHKCVAKPLSALTLPEVHEDHR